MTLRNPLFKAAIAVSALALAACGGRSSPTPDSGTPGCTGVCSTPDSGTPDSGTPDSGSPDAGPSCDAFLTDHPVLAQPVSTDLDSGTTLTLAQLRYGRQPDGSYIPDGDKGSNYLNAHVIIDNATIQYTKAPSSMGEVGFWVVDGSDAGMYIYAYSGATGTVGMNNIQVGNVVNLDGFFQTESFYYGPYGRRYVIQDNYEKNNPDAGRPLVVTLVNNTGTVTDVSVDPSCAMDARGGTANLYQDSQPNAGRRIHINGPLTITDPEPIAMRRVVQFPDGGTKLANSYGFEVTGGILVYDGNTYSSDGGFGGPDRCDWAALAKQGKTVTFPDGISGIWDTYTMQPCLTMPASDGGYACRSGSGTPDYTYVPNSKSLVQSSDTPDYTFALYPADCTDLAGDAGT